MALLAIEYNQGDNFIEELPIDTLHSPVDITYSPFAELIDIIPLGALNSPIDSLWDVAEIGEMSWPPIPPDPLYEPLDIVFGWAKEDLLMYNLILTGGASEYSFAYIT